MKTRNLTAAANLFSSFFSMSGDVDRKHRFSYNRRIRKKQVKRVKSPTKQRRKARNKAARRSASK